MVDSNSKVQNFWHDFKEEFNSWAADDQSMEVHTTSTKTITALPTSTHTAMSPTIRPITSKVTSNSDDGLPDDSFHEGGDEGGDEGADEGGDEGGDEYGDEPSDGHHDGDGHNHDDGYNNGIPENSLEIEFCEAKLEEKDSFCNWCEPLCDIHTIKPCEENWGSFNKICCGLCDVQCDVECPVLLYVLTSLFSVVGRVF